MRELDILIGSDKAMRELARELGVALGAEFVEVDDCLFEAKGEGTQLTLYDTSDLVDTGDVSFTGFKAAVSVDTSDADEQEGFAREVFGKIRRVGKVAEILVEDLSKKLDEFHPAKRSAA